MPPLSTSTAGPAFRSFSPTTNPQRYFPRLSVLAGPGTDTWEVLPSVNRNLNFRLTVRDNNSAYGCTEEDDMTVNSTITSGPFTVTYPNTEMDWEANTSETITWDVANTNAAPVSCANVDILYSTDGGLSFENTLVSNVPNDGSQTITVPDIATSLFRIMVKCSDNIFFNVTNENISIGVQTVCVTINSTDVPVSIPDSGTPTVFSDLTVALGETITDINVLNLEGTHTYIGDLRITLISPSATEVILVDQSCGSNDDFDVNFDDNGSTLNCPYNNNQTAAPAGNLSDFNSENPDGTWMLRIEDLANQDGGQLDSWSIEVCYEELNGPLPLDLLYFEAIAQKEEIILSWNTANEINNRGFEIHRSTNPQSGFNTVGWVDGLGNAIEGSYHFVDENVKPGITYYYRLKQIDFDQKFTFSDVKQAKLAAEVLQVEIAPNPASNFLSVSLLKEDHHYGEILITDILGKVLKSKAFEMNDKAIITLELNDLIEGIYFLGVTLDDDEKSIHKFIKK
jgi:subtilisin-like proprotein convertase family protein